jgi:hypothetical protein
MEQLRKQNEWGDLSDTEYRRLRSEVEAELLAIPGDAEKVALFDRHRLVVQSLGDELATATPESIQTIVALLVKRVETRDRQVVGWVPTGPAEPFLDPEMLSLWRPRTDAGAHEAKRRIRSTGTRRDGPRAHFAATARSSTATAARAPTMCTLAS